MVFVICQIWAQSRVLKNWYGCSVAEQVTLIDQYASGQLDNSLPSLQQEQEASWIGIYNNLIYVALHSTVLALLPRPKQLLHAHTCTTPASLKGSTPNEVCYVSVNS